MNIKTNSFYYVGDIIGSMMNEGYGIKEICVNKEVYTGKLIKHIDFMNYICIEFIYDEIMFVPYEQINYITLYELEDDEYE